MHTLRLGILLFFCLLFSCSDRELHKEFYSDGSLREQYGRLDGKIHGTTKRYHPNGVLSYEGEYDKGKRIGWHQHYSPSGKIKFKSFFTIVGDKELLSKRVTLDSSGNVVSETTFAEKNVDVTYDRNRIYHVGDTLRLRIRILDSKYKYCEAVLGYFDEHLNSQKELPFEPEYVSGNLNHEVVMKIILTKAGIDTLTGLIRDFDYYPKTHSSGQVVGEDSFFSAVINVMPETPS